MTVVDEVPVGPDARVYAEGWQSWSPTTWYRRGDPAHRPAELWQHLMRFRPDAALPGSGLQGSGLQGSGLPGSGLQGEGLGSGLQGEGLVVIDPANGEPVRTYATLDATRTVPTIRAEFDGSVVRVLADGELVQRSEPAGPDAGERALERFGEEFGVRAGARVSTPPRVWCTWYRYFEGVTADDVRENLAAIESLDLPIDVVQIDDGWSLGTGEWMRPNPRFGALADLVAQIRDSGRRAGIWLAPFSVGSRSALAREHPEWLTGPAGHNWGDDLVGLDLTHPGVRSFLTRVFTELRDLGIDYIKLDFLYSGAVPGERHDGAATAIEAYRSGLGLVREAAGEQAYLLGCGAPLLPSVGLVDAMRVSPDTFHEGGEDGSQGLRGRMSLQARAWQDGRLWTTDPDCLVARPQFALRDEWADVVLAAPGLRSVSDRIADLDAHGLDLVRRLLDSREAVAP